MKLRYTYRFYPTKEQEKHLARTFGACRFVFNWALRLRETARYSDTGPIGYAGSDKELTLLKKQSETEWLNEISSVPLQQALRQLQTAYQNCYSGRADHPNFRKKRGHQSAEYTKSAMKFSRKRGNRTLILAKLGKLHIRWTRSFKSDPTTVTIIKTPNGRYFASLCLDETPKPIAKTKEAVGIDLGINRLATLSNGERIANPQFFRRKEKRLAKAQRILSRRIGSKKGQRRSGRWFRQSLKVNRINASIADARKDHLNKVTTGLIRRFDMIYLEDLNIRGMMSNRCLAKSIGDASFSMFKTMLQAKAIMHGKTVNLVSRWFPSSKTCNQCKHIVVSLPLDLREWTCPQCGIVHDRDENAAINILAEGRSVSARGGARRPGWATVQPGRPRRNVNNPSVKNA